MKKMTCRYGTPCWISVENHNGKSVLKLDFRIKEYKALKQGWKECKFPDNIKMNDSLYFNEDTFHKVLEVLDYFLENEYLGDPNAQKTERGFSYLELKDLYGNTISIQESSSASSANIWFGCKTNNKAFVIKDGQVSDYEFEAGDILISDRLHLNKSKVRQLKNRMINEWAKNFSKVSKEA